MPTLGDLIQIKGNIEQLGATGRDIKAIARALTPESALHAKVEATNKLIENKKSSAEASSSLKLVQTIDPEPFTPVDDGTQSNIHPPNTIRFIIELLKYNIDDKGIISETPFIPNLTDNDNLTEYRLNYKGKTNFNNQGEVMFWATLDSCNETVSPEWEPELFFGRTEKMYRLPSAERTLDLNFVIPSYTDKEQEILIKKLNYLTQLCYPGSIDSSTLGRQPPFIRLTIGNLYTRHLGIITNLSKGFISNNTPWQTENEQPLFVDISMGVTLLKQDIEQPTFNTTFHEFIK